MIPTMHRTGTNYPSFTFTFGPESKLPQPEARSRRFENNCHKETTTPGKHVL